MLLGTKASVEGCVRRTLTGVIGALLASALAIHSPIAAANDSRNAARQLVELRARLKTLQDNLDKTRGQRDAEREALRDAERQIGQTLLTLKQLDKQRKTETVRLASARAAQERAQDQVSGEIRDLQDEARSAYILGQQEYLKLLLSQRDPASISRVLTYYQYLQRARAAHIAAARTALSRLVVIEDRIKRRQSALDQVRYNQTAKQQALMVAETERRKALAQLDQKVLSQSQQIEQLRQNEQRLTRLVKGIQSAMAHAPEVPLPGLDSRFADYRGKLRLPVRGKILDRFGQPKHIGDLKWQGIFLAAPEGRNVTAVFRGRVAYADWLRGFGLLMIIDHGNGYMSLYGHNQSLDMQVGDWVEAGQVIASVGNSGGTSRPGLYFEIRHNGTPRNPLKWCKMR